MKKVLAIAASELSDKFLLFPAAILLGAFPPALWAIRPRRTPGDVREASAVLLALLVSATLAVVLGLRSTAGDLASGRTAFYFARPITALELWLGKAFGSLLVVFGAGILVLVPLVLADGPSRPSTLVPAIRAVGAATPASLGPAGIALASAAAVTVLFLAAQAAGVAAAARSPLVAIDIALGAGVLYAVSRTARRLRFAGAFPALTFAGAAVAGALIVALAVGCYRAVKEGIDARRAAAGQSRAFWSIAGGAVLLFALLGIWVLRTAPVDLRRVDWVLPAPRGEWIAVSGPARGHRPVFLENVRTGEFVRAAFSRGTVPVISPDGSAAAWSAIDPGFPDSTFTPHTVSLADPRHPSTAWETKELHESPLLVFSSDSRRFAVVSSDRVSVWDAARGGMIVAAKPPVPLWKDSRGFSGATFAGDDVLRVYAERPASGALRTIDLYAFDLRERSFRRTGTAGPFRGAFPILVNAARDRILVREKGATIDLVDGATGEMLRTIGGKEAAFRAACFRDDGGILLFESAGGAGTLVLLSADATERRRIPLGPADRAWLLGERRPGLFTLVTGSAAPLRERRGRVLVADLGSGSVETWSQNLLPASPYAASLSGDFAAANAPGSLGTRLFFTPEGALVELEGPGRIRRILPSNRR